MPTRLGARLPTAWATARASQVLVDTPSRAAASSAWVLSVSGSRSVIRAVMVSSAAGSGARRVVVADKRKGDAVPGQVQFDPARFELAVELVHGFAEHLLHPHANGGVQGPAEAGGSTSEVVVAELGGGRKIGTHGVDVR